MNEIEDFQRLMETIKYYHVDRCKRKNCSHCYFFQGLGTIFFELESQEIKTERLRFYGIVQESPFSRIRCFINRLASLERKRLDLEQQFNKVLTNWNGAEGNMESPRFQING